LRRRVAKVTGISTPFFDYRHSWLIILSFSRNRRGRELIAIADAEDMDAL
jgi:hypothetical protein